MHQKRIGRLYWLWGLLPATAALGLLAASIAGCGNAAAKDEAGGRKSPSRDGLPRVQTIAVEQRDLARKIELPGTVEGYESAELFAKVGGYLEEISVDIGDRVQEGQVLARLSIPEMHKELAEKQAGVASAEANAQQALAGIEQAKAEVDSAQARLDEAKTELQEKQARKQLVEARYDRTRGLVERQALAVKLQDEAEFEREEAEAALATVRARIATSKAELAAVNANVQRAVTDHQSMLAKVKLAQAEAERIKTLLDYGEIRAPFDGVITKRFFDRGAFIQPADGNSAARPLLTVTRTDVVRISLDLPMDEVRWLDRGDKVVLDRINVLPNERFTGEVARFASSLDETSRMMRVEIDLENPENRLLPGYYGYVTLLLDEFKQTPVIPSSALMAEGDETFVLCMEGDVCRKRIVTTNYQDGTIVGIDSGLRGGEQIVQAGAGQYADGQQVVAVNGKTGASARGVIAARD